MALRSQGAMTPWLKDLVSFTPWSHEGYERWARTHITAAKCQEGVLKSIPNPFHLQMRTGEKLRQFKRKKIIQTVISDIADTTVRGKELFLWLDNMIILR